MKIKSTPSGKSHEDDISATLTHLITQMTVFYHFSKDKPGFILNAIEI